MVLRRIHVVTLGLVGLLTTVGPTSLARAEGNAEAGGKVYQTRCSPCHGPDGKAMTDTAKALTPKPRDHSDGAYMNALTKEHLTKVTKNGGPAVGKSPIMPPHTDLSDQQIADVVAFMRTLAVPPYSAK